MKALIVAVLVIAWCLSPRDARAQAPSISSAVQDLKIAHSFFSWDCPAYPPDSVVDSAPRCAHSSSLFEAVWNHLRTKFPDHALVRTATNVGAAAKVGAVAELEIILVGSLLALEEQQQWQAALTSYEALANSNEKSKLRDWARERTNEVKARLNVPR